MRAHLPVLVAKLAALRNADGPVDLAMTTNGATMRLVAGTLREAGLRRVNISLDTLDRGEVHRDDAPGRARQRARRHRRRPGGRIRSGQDQRRRRARGQRRRDRRPRHVRPRAGRRGPVHRVHAARRRWTLGQRAGRRPGRDRRGDQRRVPDRADAGPRCGAGRSFPLPRRSWHGRRDPDGHQAVLRRLRPGAADGRGRLPHVPVRHVRGRRCSTCCARAAPTTTSPR